MICKNCGAQCESGAFFCVNCGSRLDNSTDQTQSYNYGYNQQNDFSSSQGENFSRQYNGQNGDRGFDQTSGGAYTYNYNQSYNYTPIDPNFVKKGSIIAALAVGVLTQSWVAVVLAIIALVRCSDFENAVRMGNFQLADKKRDSIAKLRKWAWVFCIIGIVIGIITVVASIVSYGWGIFEFLSEVFEEVDDFDDFENFYGYSEMFIRMIASRLG